MSSIETFQKPEPGFYFVTWTGEEDKEMLSVARVDDGGGFHLINRTGSIYKVGSCASHPAYDGHWEPLLIDEAHWKGLKSAMYLHRSARQFMNEIFDMLTAEEEEEEAVG